MSEPIASEIEAQINSYLTHPRTSGLAKTTRDLYKTILVNLLIPFCRRQNILKLTPDLIDHMEDYVLSISMAHVAYVDHFTISP
ncbi:MAG: hypothetical protein GY860_22645 [Desulfobacteraceae bacterium]|nr:hypothetical protein [Desulfobacteraceae bacterium]